MKLGPHVLQPTDAATAWSRRAGIVKSVDDTRALREARPDAIKIFRKFFPNQDINRNGGDVAAEVLGALGDAPATMIELFNEGPSRLSEGLARYCAMTAEAIQYVHAHRPDLTVAGFSFSTGTPEIDAWQYLRGQKFGGCKVVALHSYFANAGYTPFQALRYRTLWKPGDPLIVLTEVGRDAV